MKWNRTAIRHALAVTHGMSVESIPEEWVDEYIRLREESFALYTRK